MVPLRTVPVNLLADQRDLSCVVGHLSRPRYCLHRLPGFLSSATPRLRVFCGRHPVTRCHLPPCKSAVTAESARHLGWHGRGVPTGIRLVRRDGAIPTYSSRNVDVFVFLCCAHDISGHAADTSGVRICDIATPGHPHQPDHPPWYPVPARQERAADLDCASRHRARADHSRESEPDTLGHPLSE